MKLVLGTMLCLAFVGYWLYLSFSAVPHDYSNSYFGAYFLFKGEFDVSIFDPYTFNKKIYDAGFHNVFASYSPNPPFTALLFVPFALVPLALSKLLFNIISSVLFFTSIYRLCKHLSIPAGPIFIALPFLFLLPLRNEILFGQTYFLIVFLLVEGYLAYVSDKRFLSSLFWGFAILIKVFPIIILAFLFLRKDWKTTLSLFSICILLLLFSVLFQGFDVWKFYFTEILPRNGRGEITSAYMVNYQSAHMFFKYTFLHNKDLNPEPLIDNRFLFSTFQILFKSLVLTLCSSVILQRKELIAVGLLVLGGMMISPYGSTYENLLLVIILIGAHEIFTRKIFSIVAMLIFLISNVPLSIFNSFPTTLQFPRLALYLALMLTTFYYLKVKFQWKFLAGFIFLFSFSFVLSPKIQSDNSALLIKDKNQSLVFDYQVLDSHLVYSYWTDHGTLIDRTAILAESISVDSVELKQNQIFYKGRQLTTTSDTKMKPAVLNNKSIIYLSDKDRGMGFFTLRILNLPDGL